MTIANDKALDDAFRVSKLDDFDLQLFAEGDPPADKVDDQKPDAEKTDDKPIEDDPERGLDAHAIAVLRRYRKEAESYRKKAESGEVTVREARRAADEAKRAADEARKIAEEASGKLKTKEEAELADQKKWQELAERRSEEAKKAKEEAQARIAEAEDAANKRISAYEKTLVLERVGRAADRAGLLDPEFVELPAFAAILSKITVKDGHVEGIKEAVDAMKAAKPNLFKDEEEKGGGDDKSRQRNDRGQFVPPERQKPSNNGIDKNEDAASMTADRFAQVEARLRKKAG